MSGVHEAIRESCAKEMGIVIFIESYAIVVPVLRTGCCANADFVVIILVKLENVSVRSIIRSKSSGRAAKSGNQCPAPLLTVFSPPS